MNFLKNIYNKIIDSMYYVELQFMVYIAFLYSVYILYMYSLFQPDGGFLAILYIYFTFCILCLIELILFIIHLINKKFFFKHIPFHYNYRKITKALYIIFFLIGFVIPMYLFILLIYFGIYVLFH